MNIDIKKIVSPVVDYYDKVLALITMVVLLASVLLLGVKAAVAKNEQNRFMKKLDALAPAYPAVAPVERARFQKGIRDFEQPATLDASEGSRLFMVPERRVQCVKCRKPIVYDALKCVFCGYAQPAVGKISVEKDSDMDGMPDVWELTYKLNPNNFDDGAVDTDKDGWSNAEEYKARKYGRETDPTNPADFPPPWSFDKLIVNTATSMQFNLVFMSAMKSGDGFTFQINHVEGRTYWKKMGEEVLGFVIKKYDEKYVPHPSIPNKKIDVSELTMQSADRRLVLTKGKKTQQGETSANLLFVPDSLTISVTKGKDFELRGQKYRVKDIDVNAVKVVFDDSTVGREVSVGRSGLLD